MYFLYVFVGKGFGLGVGCGLGLAAPAHPSATILWPRVTCFLFSPPVPPLPFSSVRVSSPTFKSRTRNSIGSFVRPLVQQSFGRSVMVESKYVETRISTLPMSMGMEGSVKRGCTPLPTRPRRYCNPALLVSWAVLPSPSFLSVRRVSLSALYHGFQTVGAQ